MPQTNDKFTVNAIVLPEINTEQINHLKQYNYLLEAIRIAEESLTKPGLITNKTT